MPTYGVIGSGSFGTAIANILAENGEVLVYMRREEVMANYKAGEHKGQKINTKITPTMDLQEVCERAELIFPIVSSKGFRNMMRQAAPFLKPNHILIHGTKGLNVTMPDGKDLIAGQPVKKRYIRKMTDIIQEESMVIKIGCISGPNLAREIAKGQPAATVVSSRFNEVIERGKTALRSPRFRVYSSYDMAGVELSGVLKNIMAISSGIIGGLGLGENTKAMLISRGLGEMIKIGRCLGASHRSFLGIAGVGDLVATCSSPLSRNYTLGRRLAEGESVSQVLDTMEEVVEGYNTVRIAKGLAINYNLELPIVEALYSVLFEGSTIADCMQQLMTNSLDVDADFLE